MKDNDILLDLRKRLYKGGVKEVKENEIISFVRQNEFLKKILKEKLEKEKTYTLAREMYTYIFNENPTFKAYKLFYVEKIPEDLRSFLENLGLKENIKEDINLIKITSNRSINRKILDFIENKGYAHDPSYIYKCRHFQALVKLIDKCKSDPYFLDYYLNSSLMGNNVAKYTDEMNYSIPAEMGKFEENYLKDKNLFIDIIDVNLKVICFLNEYNKKENTRGKNNIISDVLALIFNNLKIFVSRVKGCDSNYTSEEKNINTCLDKKYIASLYNNIVEINSRINSLIKEENDKS